MNVTREEAAKALEEVSQASDRIVTLKGYNQGAPHFVIWGMVWLVANTVTQFWPDQTDWAWGPGVVVGMIASAVTGVIQSRGIKPGAQSSFDVKIARRVGLTSLVTLTFISCLIFISRPETSRETAVRSAIAVCMAARFARKTTRSVTGSLWVTLALNFASKASSLSRRRVTVAA